MIRRLYTYLVAEWPVMLNDVVIAVVVVIVTEVVVRFTMMFGTTVVIAVVDDMLVRVNLMVWFRQHVGERVHSGGRTRNVLGLLLRLVGVGVVREVHDRVPVLRRELHRLRMNLSSKFKIYKRRNFHHDMT